MALFCVSCTLHVILGFYMLWLMQDHIHSKSKSPKCAVLSYVKEPLKYCTEELLVLTLPLQAMDKMTSQRRALACGLESYPYLRDSGLLIKQGLKGKSSRLKEIESRLGGDMSVPTLLSSSYEWQKMVSLSTTGDNLAQFQGQRECACWHNVNFLLV